MGMGRKGESTKVPDHERLKLWVLAGGLCTICKAYLLESPLTTRTITRGEFAHNVGQKKSRRSPRGMNDLDEAARDTAENALLLCGTCHGDIDKLGEVDLLTEQKLFEIKREHEAFVREALSRAQSPRTVVVRMRGAVRDVTDDLTQAAATQAVFSGSNRFPAFPFSGRDSVEIDLRGLAGEEEADAAYYAAATRKIDAVIAQSVRPVIIDKSVDHLSIFAFARLALLVYLGAQLDDSVATDVYQRHRASSSWEWPADAAAVVFEHRDVPRAGHDLAGASEAVLIINASGTIQLDEVPEELRLLPHFIVEPRGAVPHTDTIATPESLASFERAIRELTGHLEVTHKKMRAIHVFAAAPVSVAIVLGQCMGWGIHPSLIIYERDDGKYRRALEVTK